MDNTYSLDNSEVPTFKWCVFLTINTLNSGDNEFYSIYTQKGYVHVFFIFGLSAIRPRDAVRPRPVWTYRYLYLYELQQNPGRGLRTRKTG